MFADCDILCRADIAELFDLADDRYALMCVQHDYTPTETVKMGSEIQTSYPRKNWSSLALWNCDHPAHRALTLAHLNQWSGRDLHRFRWLWDSQIGALPPAWNYLVGVSPKSWTRPSATTHWESQQFRVTKTASSARSGSAFCERRSRDSTAAYCAVRSWRVQAAICSIEQSVC